MLIVSLKTILSIFLSPFILPLSFHYVENISTSTAISFIRIYYYKKQRIDGSRLRTLYETTIKQCIIFYEILQC